MTALRCGLDTGAWSDVGRQKCRDLIGAEPRFDSNGEAIAETLPFDLVRASKLYRDLFEGIEDLVQGKQLLIVPSGALTQLPFEALVTQKSDNTLPRFEAYKMATWLGQRQAITVLPSVGSLKALRSAKVRPAPEPFAGFGNPLLIGGTAGTGAPGPSRIAASPRRRKENIIASLSASIASVFRGGAVNIEGFAPPAAAA